MELVSVVKTVGGWMVLDHNGDGIIAYKSRKYADAYAVGHTAFIFGDAEEENCRRDNAKAYLATRAERAAKPKPQLELF